MADSYSQTCALLLFSWSVTLWFVTSGNKLAFHNGASEYKDAYICEKKSRANLEKQLRELSELQLSTSNGGVFFQPIGYIESCYKQCIGTPRQGLLVPSSRASIALIHQMSPESIDGLEDFSHVWILFRFHLNNNSYKEIRGLISSSSASTSSECAPADAEVVDITDAAAQAPVGGSGSGVYPRKTRTPNINGFTFTAKITPPMLKHTKKGVLATRSPHRPNAIGITLAQVVGIDKRTRRILLSACDLVDGTPVYDVKPYVPMYDSAGYQQEPSTVDYASLDSALSDEASSVVVQYGCVRVPRWIEETIDRRNMVTFVSSDGSGSVDPVACADNMISAQITSIERKLKIYKNAGSLYQQALVETLQADVRSKYQTRKADATNQAASNKVTLPFDNTTVSYLWNTAMDEITVVDVRLVK
jgi:tRNA (Thr-GGU) A37 N-methylase